MQYDSHVLIWRCLICAPATPKWDTARQERRQSKIARLAAFG